MHLDAHPTLLVESQAVVQTVADDGWVDGIGKMTSFWMYDVSQYILFRDTVDMYLDTYSIYI